jgi:hypothetical protein
MFSKVLRRASYRSRLPFAAAAAAGMTVRRMLGITRGEPRKVAELLVVELLVAELLVAELLVVAAQECPTVGAPANTTPTVC